MMKNLLRFTALLTAMVMVFIMLGCGGGDEGTKDTTAPKMLTLSVKEGDSVAANAAITATFNEKMGSADIAVSGATGTSALDASGKMVTWTPTKLDPGKHTVTVTGKDVAGNDLEAVAPVNITVTAPDTEAPTIDAKSCDPANGATGVDPAKYSALKIVFSESMKEAALDSIDPKDAKVDQKFDGDKTLTLTFLGGYKLSNEMTITITVKGSDKAGNALKDGKYSFVTMKKEG